MKGCGHPKFTYLTKNQMHSEKTGQKKVILLITESPYYPVFFRHHLTNFLISTLPKKTPIEEMEKINPDFIVVDDKELKESIFAICKEIKQRKRLENTPLLVISGALKTEYLQKLIEIGVSQILQEPLDPPALICELEESLRTQRASQKLGNLGRQISDFPSASDIRLRPFFSKNLLAPIIESIKNKKSLSLLAIDVEYNDIHEFTERQITVTIKKVIPNKAPLISLGKGKYLAFLDGANLEEAKFLAETIRDVITNTMHILIAIGISSQKKPAYANIQEMILDAKKALLTAQKKGTSIEIH